MEKLYEIVENGRGRRILVIKKPVNIKYVDGFDTESFDAVYVEYTHNYVADITVIWNNLPMFNDATWLKPFFLNIGFADRFSKYGSVVDGFVESVNSPDMDVRIGEIEDSIARSGVSKTRLDVSSHEDLFINFCRFCLSRGITEISNSTVKNYTKGYTSILSTLFGENDFIDKRFFFQQNLIDRGYIQKKRFVERLHVCPSCRDSHLIFIESCPKCKSSNVNEENVIHHFRCANVSPESTYEFDGELRCPKCKRFLRHIGVDYDVPASVFACQNCGHSFMNPMMRVECTHCHRTFAPEQLSVFDVEEYQFTESGIRALISDEMAINMSRNAFDGYSDYDNFLSTLRIMAYANTRKNNFVVMVVRVFIPGEGIRIREMLHMLIQPLLFRLPSFKFTMKGDYLYLMQSTDKNDMERKIDSIRVNTDESIDELLEEGVSNKCVYTVFTYDNSERITEFVKKIEAKDYKE